MELLGTCKYPLTVSRHRACKGGKYSSPLSWTLASMQISIHTSILKGWKSSKYTKNSHLRTLTLVKLYDIIKYFAFCLSFSEFKVVLYFKFYISTIVKKQILPWNIPEENDPYFFLQRNAAM